MVKLLPTRSKQEPVAADASSAFTSTPWAMELFNDNSLYPYYTPTYKHHKYPAMKCSTFQSTLNVPDAVIGMQDWYRDPSDKYPGGEFLMLVKIGPGLDAWAGKLHGGVVSLFFDEIMGHAAIWHCSEGTACVTVSLKIDLKKAIPTPCTMLFRAWLSTKSKGKKIMINGSAEDGNGKQYAAAEGTFVEFSLRNAKL